MESTNNVGQEVFSFEEIYRDSFDDEVEQSAIYQGVHFSCVQRKRLAIVLTPVCDISWGVDHIKMAGLIPVKHVFEGWLMKAKDLTKEEIAGVAPLGSKKVKGLCKEFMQYYIRNRVYRYHFLPSYKNLFPHSFVDFHLVGSFHQDSIRNLKKIAVLKSPWSQNVPARYAACCGRVGTREYSKQLLDKIMTDVSNLTSAAPLTNP